MLGRVNTQEVLAALDTEIARLQRARNLLANASVPKRQGRPPASANRTAPKKRMLSAAARARIAEAQRQRWAKQKKQKAVKVTRVAAKQAPKRRAAKAAPKPKAALTNNVPKQPVAVPAKAKDE
jgi:hypothetical protein